MIFSKKIIQTIIMLAVIFLTLRTNQALVSLASQEYVSYTSDLNKLDKLNKLEKKYDPRIFQLLSFGQIQAIADGILLDCLLDSSQGLIRHEKHTRFYYSMELLTDLDPLDLEFYILGGNLLAVLHKDKEGAQNLLTKGQQFIQNELKSYSDEFKSIYWSTPWRLYLLQAYVYLFQLNDMKKSAQAFIEAAQYSDSPAYLRQLEMRFKKPGGEYEVGLRLLKFMSTTTSDERVKSELLKKYSYLSVSQYLFEMNQMLLHDLEVDSKLQNLSAQGKKKEKAFKYFLKLHQWTDRDPWQGRIFMDQNGRIMTTTYHEPVFGLE